MLGGRNDEEVIGSQGKDDWGGLKRGQKLDEGKRERGEIKKRETQEDIGGETTEIV